jgi:hypothetical protein
MEQRVAIKFCAKLKKMATKTFETLKSAYGEECLSKTSVSEWYKRFKEGRYKAMNGKTVLQLPEQKNGGSRS